LEDYFSAIPLGYRSWSPSSWEGIPSETFTAIEQICHVRDIELDGYHERFRSILHEESPVLANLDGYLLSQERHYKDAIPSEVFAAIRSSRAETLQILSDLTAEQCKRTAIFEGYGRLTILSLAHNLCSHDQQHLAGLQWLLGKVNAASLQD